MDVRSIIWAVILAGAIFIGVKLSAETFEWEEFSLECNRIEPIQHYAMIRQRALVDTMRADRHNITANTVLDWESRSLDVLFDVLDAWKASNCRSH